MTKPSKRFQSSRFQEILVPALIILLGVALIAVIVLVTLASFGLLST